MSSNSNAAWVWGLKPAFPWMSVGIVDCPFDVMRTGHLLASDVGVGCGRKGLRHACVRHGPSQPGSAPPADYARNLRPVADDRPAPRGAAIP